MKRAILAVSLFSAFTVGLLWREAAQSTAHAQGGSFPVHCSRQWNDGLPITLSDGKQYTKCLDFGGGPGIPGIVSDQPNQAGVCEYCSRHDRASATQTAATAARVPPPGTQFIKGRLWAVDKQNGWPFLLTPGGTWVRQVALPPEWFLPPGQVIAPIIPDMGASPPDLLVP